MDVKSKIKADMESLGCKCRRKIALAYHLYMYLVDTKLMHDTEYCYNKDLDLIYIVARPSKKQRINIYVPFPTINDVSMSAIDTMQEKLCTTETGKVINLAFIEGDSNTVIYSFSKGLIDIQSAEGSRNTREERRSLIDNELRKNKDQILRDAVNAGRVDDDICNF